MKGMNWLGVILGTIVGQAVGFFWYGFAFMERWIELALGGVEPSQAEQTATIWQGILLSLFQSFGLAWLIALLGANSLIKGGWVGLFVAFFFSGAVVVQQLVYAGAPLELVTIDAGYVLVWLTIAGAVIGAVRLPARKS